jgi:hypothetical protein
MSYAIAHPEITDYSARQYDASTGKGTYYRHPWGAGPIYATPVTTKSIAARFNTCGYQTKSLKNAWLAYLVKQLYGEKCR